MQIGIIGLGLPGSAIAQRLLDGGYIVFGLDIDPERSKSLVKSGAPISHSLADIAERCDLIVLAVATTATRRRRAPA